MNGEHDMAALNDWLDKIRNTFTEAASLLQTVRELRNEVDGLKRDLDSVRQVNRTLEENLSWSRSERERLEGIVSNQAAVVNNQSEELRKLQTENVNLRAGATEDDRTIRQLRDHVAMLSFEKEEYEKEAKELREFKASVEKSLGAMTKPKEVPQPRDPVTGHWKSPKELEDEAEKAIQDALKPQTQEVNPTPMTGTDPYHY